jgi:hypothetical protein
LREYCERALCGLLRCDREWAVTRSADKRGINPVTLHGVKCMSYGLVAPGTGGRGGAAASAGLADA